MSKHSALRRTFSGLYSRRIALFLCVVQECQEPSEGCFECELVENRGIRAQRSPSRSAYPVSLLHGDVCT